MWCRLYSALVGGSALLAATILNATSGPVASRKVIESEGRRTDRIASKSRLELPCVITPPRLFEKMTTDFLEHM